MAVNTAELDMEYKVLKQSAIMELGSNDEDMFIYAINAAKKNIKLLKIATIVMMVGGVALMIILVGFILFGLGLFGFLKVNKMLAKYDYFIELAKKDPELNHKT